MRMRVRIAIREVAHGSGMVAAASPRRRGPLVLVPSARHESDLVDRRRPGGRDRSRGAGARGAARPCPGATCAGLPDPHRSARGPLGGPVSLGHNFSTTGRLLERPGQWARRACSASATWPRRLIAPAADTWDAIAFRSIWIDAGLSSGTAPSAGSAPTSWRAVSRPSCPASTSRLDRPAPGRLGGLGRGRSLGSPGLPRTRAPARGVRLRRDAGRGLPRSRRRRRSSRSRAGRCVGWRASRRRGPSGCRGDPDRPDVGRRRGPGPRRRHHLPR